MDPPVNERRLKYHSGKLIKNAYDNKISDLGDILSELCNRKRIFFYNLTAPNLCEQKQEKRYDREITSLICKL